MVPTTRNLTAPPTPSPKATYLNTLTPKIKRKPSISYIWLLLTNTDIFVFITAFYTTIQYTPWCLSMVGYLKSYFLVYLIMQNFSKALKRYPDSKVHGANMGPTWGLPGSCRPQMGPVLAPWTLLSGYGWRSRVISKCLMGIFYKEYVWNMVYSLHYFPCMGAQIWGSMFWDDPYIFWCLRYRAWQLRRVMIMSMEYRSTTYFDKLDATTTYLGFLKLGSFGSAIAYLPECFSSEPTFRILDWTCFH